MIKPSKLIYAVIAMVVISVSLQAEDDSYPNSVSFPKGLQQPVIFTKPLPDEIQLFDKVDFSFYVNQSIIREYRYRIRPVASSLTDHPLKNWSRWINDPSTTLPLQYLNVMGEFIFEVEYRGLMSNEVNTFEEGFNVNYDPPAILGETFNVDNDYIKQASSQLERLWRASEEYRRVNEKWMAEYSSECSNLGIGNEDAELSKITTRILSGRNTGIGEPGNIIICNRVLTGSDIRSLVSRSNLDIALLFNDPEANNAATMAAVSRAVSRYYRSEYDQLLASSDSPSPTSETAVTQAADAASIERQPITEAVDTLIAEADTDLTETSDIQETVEGTLTESVNLDNAAALLKQALEDHNSTRFRSLITQGAGSGLTGRYGGNILHEMAGKMQAEDLVQQLKESGVNLDQRDEYGNTPLNYSLLIGDTKLANELIKAGADVNLKNNMELSPMHISTYYNDLKITRQLLVKNASPNTLGPSGYTPLHIAVEMNHYSIASDLLATGGDIKIETDQGLNSKKISKYQRIPKMKELVSSYGNSFNTVNRQENTKYPHYGMDYRSAGYPAFDFNLPYDPVLLKQKKAWSTVRWIALPLTLAGAAATYYFYYTASDSWSKYTNATNNDDRKYYYDETLKLDTYTYIAAGATVIPLYFVVHASIKIPSVKNKLRKTF